ncbi:2-dehydropantoate 2-reductase [Marinivivus vitaminiproducens]|uniref:2-dehydropantoate 2-reductase n=1 Tax=Marinivivus vitaminiproducens TaxID=3035935 RepID=UPI002798CEB1|nr:2-dehydropantoate 2-reductase [Geminicoccaceae bacterium SCSIO 64248]
MRIAIVGAGAIGGYLAVRLAEAGTDVTVIARGANLEAIRKDGLRLAGEDGGETVARDLATAASPAEAGPHDAVLLTVKAHQVGPIAGDLAALCHDGTSIVTMQNGIPWWYFHDHGGALAGTRLQTADPGGAIAAHVDAARVIGCVVYPAAILEAPGVVRVIEGNRFGLGELSGAMTDRVQALSQILAKAGFRAPVTKDIRAEIWLKLWGNLSLNPVSALTHATLVDLCEFEPTRSLIAAMMAEARDVAGALGVTFKLGIDKRIEGARKVGAHKTSMLQDVEAGRPIELDALVGSVIELGRLTDIATPHIDAVHACMQMLTRRIAEAGHGLRLGQGGDA